MGKYRIRIEKLDYEHNLIHQHQVEITENMIYEIKKTHGIEDVLDKLWEQLKHEFFHHLNKEKQRQALIEMMQNDGEVGLYNLSKEDVEQIIKTCELSPNPNETLRRAAKRYKDEQRN